MAEYIRDSDGFAWEYVGGDRWALPDGTTLSQEEVNRQFGPLTTYGGEPLNPAPDDARALLANAFDYFTTTAREKCYVVGANPFDAGKLTAEALRDGTITS